MQLTDNFSLEELAASETAGRSRIDDTPPEALLGNLCAPSMNAWSAFASPSAGRRFTSIAAIGAAALNKAADGAQNSLRIPGLAADVLCPRFGTPLQACAAIANAAIPTNEIIHEFGK